MNKIKRIILNFISEEDDLVCFFLVTINGDMYIYNKDTDHLIEYIPVISEQGKIINFTVKIYDINCNFITKKNYKSEDLNS